MRCARCRALRAMAPHSLTTVSRSSQVLPDRMAPAGAPQKASLTPTNEHQHKEMKPLSKTLKSDRKVVYGVVVGEELRFLLLPFLFESILELCFPCRPQHTYTHILVVLHDYELELASCPALPCGGLGLYGSLFRARSTYRPGIFEDFRSRH